MLTATQPNSISPRPTSCGQTKFPDSNLIRMIGELHDIDFRLDHMYDRGAEGELEPLIARRQKVVLKIASTQAESRRGIQAKARLARETLEALSCGDGGSPEYAILHSLCDDLLE